MGRQAPFVETTDAGPHLLRAPRELRCAATFLKPGSAALVPAIEAWAPEIWAREIWAREIWAPEIWATEAPAQ